MTQEEWLKIFLGDISACRSAYQRRRWGVMFAEDIQAKCPEYVDEVRAAYAERLGDLRSDK